MGNFIRRVWQQIVWAYEAQALFAWLIPTTVIAAATAWFAIALKEQTHLVIFYTAGVFCFVTLTVIAAVSFGAVRSQKYKLVHRLIRIVLVTQIQNTQEIIITLGVRYINRSIFPIFAHVIDLDVSIAGRTIAPFQKIADLFIPAHQSIQLVTPPITLPDSLAPLVGEIEVAVKYGRSKDDQRNIYRHKATVTLLQDANTKAFRLSYIDTEQSHA